MYFVEVVHHNGVIAYRVGPIYSYPDAEMRRLTINMHINHALYFTRIAFDGADDNARLEVRSWDGL